MGSFFEKLHQLKREQWILLASVGILIIIICFPTEKKSSSIEYGVSQSEQISRLDEMEKLEERLERILGKMEGAGSVKVMITQKSSGEKIVEKDIPVTSRESSEENENGTNKTVEQDLDEVTVYEKDEQGNQIPYVVQELSPAIEGVLVLAQGGDNAVVVKNITDAVMALFGLEAHKIKVMKML